MHDLNITISTTSERPIYQQIYDQISAQIINGELPGDFCLPPIRTVAKELRVSIITVKRAWEELEHNGFIYTMTGRGCFVKPHPAEKLNTKRTALVSEKLIKDIEYYKSLGLSMSDVIELLEELWDTGKHI